MTTDPDSSDRTVADRAAESSDDRARRAWRALSALVLDDDRKAAVSRALGLSFARSRALRRLKAEPLTMRALAAKLNADPPYVTLIVDDLEKRGLVERQPHPEDRRAKLVSLTDAGRAAVLEAEQILDAPPAALSALSSEDLDALLRVLERIRP